MSLWLEGGQGKWVGSLGLGIRQDTLPGLGQPGGEGPPPHTVTQTILGAAEAWAEGFPPGRG